LGLSVRGAVLTIYVAGVVLGGSALLMSQLGSSARIVGVVGLLVAAAAVAVPLARVHVYGERPLPKTAGDTGHPTPVADGTEPEALGNGKAGIAITKVARPGGPDLVRRRT
jgi:hypothetical protein